MRPHRSFQYVDALYVTHDDSTLRGRAVYQGNTEANINTRVRPVPCPANAQLAN